MAAKTRPFKLRVSLHLYSRIFWWACSYSGICTCYEPYGGYKKGRVGQSGGG
ncbi:hypothetical protein MKW92_046278 [Papaver armeniacum]|nr:hypothetical protein MKW92_046278 [Papaver armeniacum]